MGRRLPGKGPGRGRLGRASRRGGCSAGGQASRAQLGEETEATGPCSPVEAGLDLDGQGPRSRSAQERWDRPPGHLTVCGSDVRVGSAGFPVSGSRAESGCPPVWGSGGGGHREAWERSGPKFIQVISRIRFPVVVGLRSRFLTAVSWGHPQLLGALSGPSLRPCISETERAQGSSSRESPDSPSSVSPVRKSTRCPPPPPARRITQGHFSLLKSITLIT